MVQKLHMNSKTKIIDAYVELRLKNKDVKPLIKEICALAKVNKTTFYRNYKDVNDLIVALREKTSSLIINGINSENMFTLNPEAFFNIAGKNVLSNLKIIEACSLDGQGQLNDLVQKKLINILKENKDYQIDEIKIDFITGGTLKVITNLSKYSSYTSLEQLKDILSDYIRRLI